ncbi:MAG: hypothetical protein QE263_03605 [Vampirovibrionales bacterium]|nr:hypothetical protein [Vampirovibrionales bacterium]
MPTLLKSPVLSGKLKKQRRSRLAAPATLTSTITAPTSASTATMLKFVALQQHQSQLLSWMNNTDTVDYSFIR